MSWAEAIRLTERLKLDPSSHVAASMSEWAHPLSFEGAFLADLIDVQVKKALKKGAQFKPRPRPWDPKPKRWGSGRFTIPQLRELLRRNREG